MATRTRERRKTRQDEAEQIAARLLPDIQAHRREHVATGVVNFTDEDQRAMMRSGEKRTIRRRTRIERLVSAGTIDRQQGRLCEWYADQHEAGYATRGGSSWDRGGATAFGSTDLLARHRAQAIARENYQRAREAISPILLSLFERVVLGRIGLGEAGNGARYSRLSLSFRRAVRQLEEAVGHLVSMER